ncbi:MAG: histidine phosphotransferase family protein, partial [Pseudomonadota bacterium]
ARRDRDRVGGQQPLILAAADRDQPFEARRRMGRKLAVEAIGPRARLRSEVLAGLRGEAMGEGLHGHWVQAYYVHLFLTDAGGRIFADVTEEQVTFAASIPA